MKLMPSVKRYISSFGIAIVLALSGVSILPWEGAPEVGAYTTPGYNGKITFFSNRDGDYEIYVMNADGSNQTRLTNIPGWDWNPKWSPDGSRIAFESNRDGNYEIYVMDADGSNQTQLTNVAGNDRYPQWSPDGARIAFISYRDGNAEIYVMNADGSNQTQLTNAVGADSNPQWSPDGSRIVFESNRDGNLEIYVMNADGSNQTRLTNAVGADSNPQWSPDGSRIEFKSNRDGNDEIYVMDADGSNQTRLTNMPEWKKYYISISPNGTKLAVLLADAGYESYRLLLMNIDGSNQQVFDYTSQGMPIMERVSWSPDGKKLQLTGYSEGRNTWDHYIVNADGTNLLQLTHDGVSGYGSWQPLPNTPPVLAAKTTTLQSGTSRLVDVLAGATDEEALSGSNISVTGAPTHGSASVEAGKVRYTASASYAGSDSLEYQVCDSFLLDQKCSTKTLGITVTPALGVTKINGENYDSGVNSYSIASLRPTFSGTATPGAEVTVEIHSDPIILTTTADGSGNWSVTPTFDLPTGEHMVYISASLNGLTTELSVFGLTIGGLASTGESLDLILLISVSLVLGGISLLYRRRVLPIRGQLHK